MKRWIECGQGYKRCAKQILRRYRIPVLEQQVWNRWLERALSTGHGDVPILRLRNILD